ncbi:MAG: guanylate kinase, partial [Clostridia bacterium]|nr:guanylate kinase [Clostridia bacterium]
EIKLSVSITTRSPRSPEKDGVDYYFVSREKFQELIAKGALLEWAEVYGEYYGTPLDLVKTALNSSQDVILEIDVQGALQIKKQYPEAILIFVIPPNKEVLAQRLLNRQTESPEKVQKRLDWIVQELTYIPNYDYIIINDLLPESVLNFASILRAEKCRSQRVKLTGWID